MLYKQLLVYGNKTVDGGLPWWLSGKESACQCRRYGFDPWSGKIPHATEQLNPLLLSVANSYLTLCYPVDCSKPGFPVHHQPPELAQTHVHRIGDAIQPSHHLIIPFSSHLQSFPASGSFRMSVLHIRWPKYWSFSFSISLSNEYSGLISFRIGWFDLLAVQGTLKSLLQHTIVFPLF